MQEVTITFDCDCGEEIKHKLGILTDSHEIKIPWDVCSQTVFRCMSCNCTYYTGDFEYIEEKDV